MKIVLVSPWWKNENSYPPLGLAYIGAVLEKDGHEVKIVDMTLDTNILEEDKADDIISFSPDIIGISCMSHNYANAIKIASYIKKKANIPIVFGGPHPTIMYKDILKNGFVDFIIMGEGEETFKKLCQNLETNTFENIDGLCHAHNEVCIINPKNDFINNLDEIPFPARHLLRMKDYKLFDDYGNRMATIISSRGCPYRCTYCYKGLFGVTYRERSPQNIIEEIKQCKEEFGYNSFYFIDDLFTMSPKRIYGLTKAIKEENLDIRWQCLARVNNSTLEMFNQMKDSGCYKVHFGIESGNQNILNRVKKGITIGQVRNAVKNCKKARIRTKGYFMLGLPGDTMETMQDTLDFATELKLDDAMFSIATPFPGTELWNNIDRNKVKSMSDAFYHSCDSDDINIFYNLSDASDRDIIDMAMKARKITNSLNTKTFCEKRFGKRVGPFAFHMSKISLLKMIGKAIIGNKNTTKTK